MMLSRSFALLVLAVSLSGCMGMQVHERKSGQPVALTLCHKGESLMQRSTLFFGASRPQGGVVSVQDWTGFLETWVTPAFPDGLTWFDAHGQWRGASRVIEREDTRVLVLLHGAGLAVQRRLDAVADAYKKLFGQEAVLQERAAVCVRM